MRKSKSYQLCTVLIFLNLLVRPIENGRYDWVLHINEQRNSHCLLYGKRYFCRTDENPSPLEIKANSNACRYGTLLSFAALKNHGYTAQALLDWFVPFYLIEEYADYLNGSSNSISSDDTLICNCSNNYIGTNCDYQLVTRTYDIGRLIEVQRGKTFSEYETLTSLIDQMPCVGAFPPIEWRQVCDGIVHCENGTDEIDCHLLEFHRCAADEYQCRNGMCIPEEFLFDGDFECMDLSDEQELPKFLHKLNNCPVENDAFCDERLCRKGEFSCGDGQCVHWTALINGANGCRNRRHEAYRCHLTPPSQMASNRMYGICQQTMMPLENFTDASNCLANLHRFLTIDQWQHVSNQRPISLSNILELCPEKIQYPNHTILFPGMTIFYDRNKLETFWPVLPNLYCFNRTVLCQNERHDSDDAKCLDANEIDRLASKLPFFSPFHLFCQTNEQIENDMSYECNGSFEVISLRRLNDGYNDCLYGDDERNRYGILSSSNRYRCETVPEPHQYVRTGLLGNGQTDCLDGSDEMTTTINWSYLRCDIDGAYACLIYRDLRNHIGRVQLPYHRYCDGNWDLVNGTDEKHCSQWTCSPSEYQCRRTGQCINRRYLCDDEWDCSDGEDELRNCSSKASKWGLETSSCTETNELFCFTKNYLMNRTIHRPCIPSLKMGDGQIDCIGGRDERNTFMCPDRQMLGDRFVCDQQTKCLNYTQVCDGVDHCRDGTDESLCFWNRNRCLQGEYACYNGTTKCVFRRCENRARCIDNSHLFWCPSSLEMSKVIYRSSKRFNDNTYRHKFCLNRKPTARLSSAYLPTPSIFSQNITGFCNRGFYLIASDRSKAHCFCPPSYYGSRCQYDQRRVIVRLRFDRLKRLDIPVIINVLVALIYNYSQIVDHHWTYDVAEDDAPKHKIYLLYPRPKLVGNFAIRFEAYHHTTLLALWQYPISPLDFLPVFSFAKVFRFPSRIPPDRCPNNPCLNGGTCLMMNDGQWTCFCQRGWEGSLCEIAIDHTSCAPHAVVRSKHVCICPDGYLLPRCYVRNRKCDEPSPCSSGSACWTSSLQPPNTFLCVCDRIRCDRGLFITINSNRSNDMPILLQFLKILSEYPILSQQILVRAGENFPIAHRMKGHSIEGETSSPPEVGLLFTFEPLEHKVDIVAHLLNTDCAEKRHANLTFDLNVQLNRCERLSESKYSAIKNPVKLCQETVVKSCFLWKNYLCYCNESAYGQHTCLPYYQSQMTCSHCYNNGYCVRGSKKNSVDFICVCPRCVSGDLCQDAPGQFSISFEYLFEKTRWNSYHFLISSMLLLCAIILNNLCLVTFLHRQGRQSCTGIYLLIISVTNQLIFITLFLRVCYLYIVERDTLGALIHQLPCKILPYLMDCLYFTTLWLMAFITIDRAMIANLPNYSKSIGKPKLAILLSLITMASVSGSFYPQMRLYKLVIHPTDRHSSCIREVGSHDEHHLNYIRLVHQISPFLMNLVAALFIILAISRSKARAHNVSARYSLRKQVGQRMDLLIGPTVCFITQLPQTILVFLDICDYQSKRWFLHLFLATFYISFTPNLAMFLLYLLPSAFYKHLLMKETFIGKRILSKISF